MYVEIMIALAFGVFIGIITGIRNTYPELKNKKRVCGHRRTTNGPQGFLIGCGLTEN